jgi:hypothetical protein
MEQKTTRYDNNYRIELVIIGIGILVLVIAVVVLYSSSNIKQPTNIVALAPYLYQGALLHKNNFTFTFGQATGSNWTASNIIFVVKGSQNPVAVPHGSGCYASYSEIPNGQEIYVSITGYDNNGTCMPFNMSAGDVIIGTLWGTYRTSVSSNSTFTKLTTEGILKVS